MFFGDSQTDANCDDEYGEPDCMCGDEECLNQAVYLRQAIEERKQYLNRKREMTNAQ